MVEFHVGWGSAFSKPVEKELVMASCVWATVSLGDVGVLPVLHAAAVTATVAKSAMRGATRVTKLTSLMTSSRVRGYRRECQLNRTTVWAPGGSYAHPQSARRKRRTKAR